MAKVGTRLLTLTVAGNSATDQVATAKFTAGDADSDFVTFADAAAGGARQYNLEFTAAQDMVSGTLWDLIWTSPGTTVLARIAPYGNAVASVAQPHYEASVVVKEPDGDFIGGDADVSTTAKMTYSAVWPCTAKPTKITS
jgi:hypothetical protein